MQTLSEQMIRHGKQKPDPDYCQKWYATSVTTWLLEQLQITHQQALEALREVSFHTSEEDMKRVYQLQASALQVEEIIETIEAMKRKEGDE